MARFFEFKHLNSCTKIDCQTELNALLMEINRNQQIQLSCWGTFKLKKAMIPMFMNAVIPFSVLVLELTEAIVKTRSKVV